jgi:hypothetical protein
LCIHERKVIYGGLRLDKSKLDYDRLLDDWAEDLFILAEHFKMKTNQCELDSFKNGYYSGKHDGIIEAIASLAVFETRKKGKYIMK